MSANRIPARVARLLLGRRLRDLRIRRGMRASGAAGRSGVAEATVWRMERADVRCRYRADALELVRELEGYACRVRCYSPALVPELLRTAEYARAVLDGSSQLVEAERERIVEVLRGRQDAMLARTGARFEFLVEAAAVERVVGGKELMAEQARSLAGVGGLEHVTVRVLTEDLGVHCRLGVGGFTILEFPEDARFGRLGAVVRVERSAGGVLLLDSPQDASGFEEIWAELAAGGA